MERSFEAGATHSQAPELVAEPQELALEEAEAVRGGLTGTFSVTGTSATRRPGLIRVEPDDPRQEVTPVP